MAKSKISTHQLVLGGLFIALFFISANILPAFFILPKVPVTFEILVAALMGGMLGLRGGLLSIGGLFAATLVGLPMMSGFSGGPAAFAKPTGGYIIGFALLVAVSGAAGDLLRRKKAEGSVHRAGFVSALAAAMIVGVLLDYLCGIAWLAVYNGYALSAFPSLFIAGLVYLPLDIAKCAVASGACAFFEFTPGLSFAGNGAR